VIVNILIVAGALVALLGLVDFFLTERQKTWVETRAIAAWDRIDEMKKFPLTEWWRRGRLWQWAVTLLCCAVFAYGWALPNPSGQDPIPGPPWLAFATVMMVAFIISRWVIDYLLPMLSPPPTSVAFWLFPVVVGALTALGFVGLTRVPSAPGTFGIGAVSGILAFFGTMGLFAWVMAALPLLVVYLLAVSLSSVEYLVRRIAEYKRGPLVAVGVLVGGVATLIKAFL
jgi:hypothetical protein